MLKHFKDDLFGGITAGIVALPLALAFGVQSGLGAIAGLYGAMILGVFAALFGGTATQISGPTGPMTVITAMVVASAIEMTGSLKAGMGVIVASFLLSGVFQIIFGFVKIGRYIRYIPYSVLSGFMTGIGVLIIIYQIFPFMGHRSPSEAIDVVLNLRLLFSEINFSALGIGGLTIVIIYLFPLLTRRVPSILVALIVSTSLSVMLQLDIPIIKDIPQGWPEIRIGELYTIDPKFLWPILEFAIMLAALGTIDSLLTAVIADNLTKTKHNSNQELIGQGIGNMLSASVAGLPGAGATMRTVVNINAGGKTRLSGIIHGLLLFAILFEFGKYAAYIPLSVLAGILITVGIGIIDYRGLKHIVKIPKTDAFVLGTVLLITVFGNLLHAVGVGMVLACVLFMKQISDIAESQSSVKSLDATNDDGLVWHGGEEDGEGSGIKGDIFIKYLEGPLFFGVTSYFQDIIDSLSPNTRLLVLKMDQVPYIDLSGIYAMEDSIRGLQQRGVVVVLTGLQKQPLELLKKVHLIPALIPQMHVFVTFEECKRWLKDNDSDLKGIV